MEEFKVFKQCGNCICYDEKELRCNNQDAHNYGKLIFPRRVGCSGHVHISVSMYKRKKRRKK